MKKIRKATILILLLAMSLFSMACFNGASSNVDESNYISFKEATYEQKQEFIEAYLKKPSDAGYQTIAQLNNAIKNHFNYPETVSLDWETPLLLERGYVVEADSGWVFITGSGKAENAFKQKSAFNYSAKLQVNDTIIRILEVKIN